MDDSYGKMSYTKLCENGLGQSNDMASFVPVLFVFGMKNESMNESICTWVADFEAKPSIAIVNSVESSPEPTHTRPQKQNPLKWNMPFGFNVTFYS